MYEQVKAVYVKHLPKNVTQDQLKKLFEHHGKITKVVLPPAKSGQERNRIGFVHFAERSSAMKALKNTERYELDGSLNYYYSCIFVNIIRVVSIVLKGFFSLNFRSTFGVLPSKATG